METGARCPSFAIFPRVYSTMGGGDTRFGDAASQDFGIMGQFGIGIKGILGKRSLLALWIPILSTKYEILEDYDNAMVKSNQTVVDVLIWENKIGKSTTII
ncbi:hypothetical protein CDAR_309831 [Caerostris darwini]|uniref:Uncharacterized protein n=1 Tax=Caerostris darwini TaxID=1538125 RepID=A0AAV4VWW6_9ARAC|nr:hypothetical protein CDAR_309831 [Caerostris darwini]